MANLSNLSNEELLAIAGLSSEPQVPGVELANLSDDELRTIAELEQQTGITPGLNPEFLLPTFITGAQPGPGERTIFGDIFERPGAAFREGIRSVVAGEDFSEGFSGGAASPELSETFQEQMIKKAIDAGGGSSPSVTVNFLKGLPGSIGGLVADIFTNPADVLVDVVTLGGSKAFTRGSKLIQTTKDTKKLAKQVDSSFGVAIKPSARGKNTAAKVRKAKADARVAVDTIVNNKQNLKFVDESGRTVGGVLPENIVEFSEAVSQTKDEIYKSYKKLQDLAGLNDPLISVDDIVKELRKVAKSDVTKVTDPQAIKGINKLATALSKKKAFSLDEAADAVKDFNAQLATFYKNPQPLLHKEMAARSMAANILRKKLDDVVEDGIKTADKLDDSLGGVKQSYRELKLRYGSLKEVEGPVNRKLAQLANRNPRSLVDFSDIFTGQQLIGGALRQDPVEAARGFTGMLAKLGIKRANDPNIIIRNMFRDVEALKLGTGVERSLRFNPVRSKLGVTPIVTRSLDREEE